MALIDALLEKITNSSLQRALREQVDQLLSKQSYGLVFQQHKPETVELHNYTVARNCKVKIKSEGGDLYLVERVKNGIATIRSQVDEPELWDVGVDDLVVVREFGDPIYPGLASTGRVDRGGDKRPHLVINAENFHALETLLYTHEGLVDAIYIDPPYNTRDKDWKYNNDYVDSDDVYRHSKWLAMMERRLKLAARLLNPTNSILIVTIDEKEFLRLGLLLEQTFRGARMQMVSSVINRKGVPRQKGFSRVDEYIFFVYIGEAGPALHDNDMLSDPRPVAAEGEKVTWIGLRRRGSEWRRSDRPDSFFPLFLDKKTAQIVEIGDPLPENVNRSTVKARPGCVTVWPLNKTGAESRWQLSPKKIGELLEVGYLRTGFQRNSKTKFVLEYLSEGQRAQIEAGTIKVIGEDANGAVIVTHLNAKLVQSKSTWNLDSHGATAYGTQMVTALLPGRAFPYPKSLYAVEDALRFFVGSKRDATILDFFAGSGTTMHAVARLNRQDGGYRRSICITNNEVSDAEATLLREQGYYPGHPEWEALGICEHITKPRVEAAITGRTPDGNMVTGNYKFVDEFPISLGFNENAEFFNLTYENPDLVNLGRRFEALAPLFWLKAGGKGPRIEKAAEDWALPETANYGVLFNTDHWRVFVDEVIARHDAVDWVFIDTDSVAVFQQIIAELPSGVQSTQLYDDYLQTFELNTKGRA
ncbi:MAG TPA: DNA methyltransferase [Actinophytocola sp.]|nr:DNA methyltransferase [Actinophytocola sp.]